MTRGHDWDAIRDKYLLSEVVGKSVKLKKIGREFIGCCPFHDEKTASFRVNDEKQFYYCFGCKTHGDVVDFTAFIGKTDTAAAVAALTGGKPPRISEEDREARQRWLDKMEALEAEQKEKSRLAAIRRWDNAHALDGQNAYLEKKGGIPPHSCRVEKQNLLVPVYDRDGEMLNVQSIWPDGTKRFEYGVRLDAEGNRGSGAPTGGGRFCIGIYMGRTILCEGFATGASIFEASPDQVCVTFSSWNLPAIAREMHAEGRNIIIAADRKDSAAALALGAELDVPVIIPPSDIEGDDFNDLHQERGIEAVRATFAQGLIDFQNRPPPPEPPPFCNIEFVEAFDFSEADIPLRPWLVPGALMSGCTHILAAPGGTGKSLFTLQFAIMLARGTTWGNWKPKRKCRVMIINAEDDVDEQRRRLSAARTVMEIPSDEPTDGILIAKNPSSIMTAHMDEKVKRPVATPLVGELVEMIRYHQIDAIIVDPFAETFEGDENSNNDAKWAMKVWRDDIARATGCAVYLVHHTTKNAGDKAGSADAIRGAGALVNSARMASTLFVMTEGEAEPLGVKPEERYRYVRYDDAKANASLIGNRHWFEKISVVIQNGQDGDSQGGDEVGALKPWSPSGIEELSEDHINAILKAVGDRFIDEHGVCTDQPFTPTKRGGSKRWIGSLIMDIAGVEEVRAKTIFTSLKDRGILVVAEYVDEDHGRPAQGVFPRVFDPK